MTDPDPDVVALAREIAPCVCLLTLGARATCWRCDGLGADPAAVEKLRERDARVRREALEEAAEVCEKGARECHNDAHRLPQHRLAIEPELQTANYIRAAQAIRALAEKGNDDDA